MNDIATTGQYPEATKDGVLVLLQKLSKKKGPPSNLTPVITPPYYPTENHSRVHDLEERGENRGAYSIIAGSL